MLGDVTGLISIENCVVRRSFNRAYTIHGVSGLRVYNNVAFDVAGHAFFIEDGTETGNLIQNNLALKIYPQYDMLATDTVPGEEDCDVIIFNRVMMNRPSHAQVVSGSRIQTIRSPQTLLRMSSLDRATGSIRSSASLFEADRIR